MWLVFIIIALALAAFVLMDAQGPGGGAGASMNTAVGTVAGQKVKQMDFEKTFSTLFNNAPEVNAGREALWNYFVQKGIVDKEANALGMSVSRDELMDLQFGANLSPIIYQSFANPQTGQLDVAQLQQIKNQLESGEQLNPQFAQFWAEQEKQIKTTQLQTKLNNMVAKGFYTPNWMAETIHKEENGTVDVAVVKIPFDNIQAGDLSVSDADLTAYANKYKHEYEVKEETRKVDLVTYNIVATPEDTATWSNENEEVRARFQDATNDSLFALGNNGFYSPLYIQPEQLDEFYLDRIADFEVGQAYGPFLLGPAFQSIKVVDKKVLPDSVNAAHILRRVTPGNEEQLTEANRLIDSLQNVLSRNKSKFGELAAEFSEDATNKDDDGDLGYFTQGAIPPFNNLAFHTGQENNIYKIETQLGVHLVYIKDQKYLDRDPEYQVAIVNTAIVPSKNTESEAYDIMLDLVDSYQYMGDLKAAAAGNPLLTVETSPGLKINDYEVSPLAAGNSSRDIVKFAFDNDTKVNDVSANVFQYTDPIRYYTNKYVIAGLNSIAAPGIPSAADLRNEIEFTVMNQKKGEKAVASISGSDLNGIASQYNVTVDTIRNINLLNTFVAGLGNEPAVTGAAYAQGVNSVSQPILGNSGVFVVKTIGKNEAGDIGAQLSILKNTISGQKRTSSQFGLVEALKENVKIEDGRAKFY